MRFESQTHPQYDHVDRITDCSTRYGQASAVCTRVRLAKGSSGAVKPKTLHFGLKAWNLAYIKNDLYWAI